LRFILPLIVRKPVLLYLTIASRKEPRGGAEMITTRKERIEFNPNKNLMGWMIEGKRQPQRHTAAGPN
jgi:hypothetical protein